MSCRGPIKKRYPRPIANTQTINHGTIHSLAGACMGGTKRPVIRNTMLLLHVSTDVAADSSSRSNNSTKGIPGVATPKQVELLALPILYIMNHRR